MKEKTKKGAGEGLPRVNLHMPTDSEHEAMMRMLRAGANAMMEAYPEDMPFHPQVVLAVAMHMLGVVVRNGVNQGWMTEEEGRLTIEHAAPINAMAVFDDLGGQPNNETTKQRNN